MPDRNRLRTESNERLDLGDLKHLQLAGRLAVRYGLRAILFAAQDSTAGKASQKYWDVTTSGSEVTVNAGVAWVGEEMEDASIEIGASVGIDGDASQVLDLTGQPANTYYIYVRSDWSSGVSGTRVFWNGTTEEEDVAAIDTREVSGWKASYATSSPGDQFLQVGMVAWDGAAFTSSSNEGEYLFEGNLDASGVETAAAWGDGGNHRNTDRAQYGIGSLQRWAAAMRRQVTDIIGTGNWFDVLPQTAVVSPGTDVNLVTARDHIDTVTDAHTDSPTWTGQVTITGTGELQIDSGGMLDVNSDFNFSERGTFEEGFYLPTVFGAADLPRFDDAVTNGFISFRHVGVGDGFHVAQDGAFSMSVGGGWLTLSDSGPSNDVTVLYDITNLFASAAAGSGAYLQSITLYAREASGMTSSHITLQVSLYQRGAIDTAPTLLSTVDVQDSDLAATVTALAVTADLLTPLSAANRTIDFGNQYVLRVRYLTENGVADSAFFHGFLISASEKELHP